MRTRPVANLEGIFSKQSTAEILAKQIASGEVTFDQVFGKHGDRKKYPRTLREAVLRKLRNHEHVSYTEQVPEKKHSSPNSSISEVNKPSSLTGQPIYSKNGQITGGSLTTGRFYDIYDGKIKLHTSKQLIDIIPADTGIVYRIGGYLITDSVTKDDLGLAFIEVPPPAKPKIDYLQIIKFSPGNSENIEAFKLLHDKQIYEVKQPANGYNFDGIFNLKGSKLNQDAGTLDFTAQKIHIAEGEITVRAVAVYNFRHNY